jgi:hypothetical protein
MIRIVADAKAHRVTLMATEKSDEVFLKKLFEFVAEHSPAPPVDACFSRHAGATFSELVLEEIS